MKIKKEVILVIALLVVAAAIRLWRINSDLLIHYDQGKDLLVAQEMWRFHRPTLLGPVADDESTFIYFGPLYYYLISIPLWITGGNPVSAMVFLILLEVGSMGLFYLGARKLFGRQVAILTLALMGVSYGLVSYSRWLSNAMPILMLGNLLFYLSCLLFEGKNVAKWWWFTMGLIFAFHPASGIGLFIFGLIWDFNRRTKIKGLITDGIFFLIPAIPQILFELRHDFLTTRGILRMFTQFKMGETWQHHWIDVRHTLITFLNGVLGQGLKGVLIVASLIIIFSLLQKSAHRKARLLCFALIVFQVGIMFFLKRPIYGHFFVAVTPILIVLLVKSAVRLQKVLGTIFCLALIFFNLRLDVIHFSKPDVALIPIGTANLVTIDYRMKMINFIKDNSEGKTYTLWTYTIPYFDDQPWTYLMMWKHMAMPVGHGDVLFTLYERDWVRPQRQVSWLEDINMQSEVVKSDKAGDFTIELRSWLPVNKGK